MHYNFPWAFASKHIIKIGSQRSSSSLATSYFEALCKLLTISISIPWVFGPPCYLEIIRKFIEQLQEEHKRHVCIHFYCDLPRVHISLVESGAPLLAPGGHPPEMHWVVGKPNAVCQPVSHSVLILFLVYEWGIWGIVEA